MLSCPQVCSRSFRGSPRVTSVRVVGNVDPDLPLALAPFYARIASGCTTTQPAYATGPSCALKPGTRRVLVELTYRPLVWIGESGVGEEGAHLHVSGRQSLLVPGGDQDAACDGAGGDVRACVQHFDPGKPLNLQAPSQVATGSYAKAWDGCSSPTTPAPGAAGTVATCTIAPQGDSCVNVLVGDPDADFPRAGHVARPQAITPNSCGDLLRRPSSGSVAKDVAMLTATDLRNVVRKFLRQQAAYGLTLPLRYTELPKAGDLSDAIVELAGATRAGGAGAKATVIASATLRFAAPGTAPQIRLKATKAGLRALARGGGRLAARATFTPADGSPAETVTALL